MMRLILLLALLLPLAACRTGVPVTDAPPTAADRADLSAEDAAFLDDVQERTFRWFWETTNPENGLVPDRAPEPPFASIAAVGFGLTAYGVGVERGYITREEALERTLATLRFFDRAPQGPDAEGTSGRWGLFYHFLDMETGHRYQTTELSTIDTALLLFGALYAMEFFDRDDPREAEVRRLADRLYREAEWDRFQVDGSDLITMAWRPERGFGAARYQGMDEAMFLYVLGLGSPTHPVSDRAWEAYTDSYLWGTFHGQEYVQFSPLFGYQYAHVWIDPQTLQDDYLRDRGIDYHENSRRATLAHRNYAIANPRGFEDYGEDIWGLTACDGPGAARAVVAGDTVQFHSYWARGVSLRDIRDDGTIAPTAAGGSVPFAPEVTIPALKAMQARYGDAVYNRYGFVDAFNPTFDRDLGVPLDDLNHGFVEDEHGWFDDQQLGIDQGPILLMAENYRTGSIWQKMHDNPYVVRGLCRAGFTADWLTCE